MFENWALRPTSPFMKAMKAFLSFNFVRVFLIAPLTLEIKVVDGRGVVCGGELVAY
jgi:hypothetical protein